MILHVVNGETRTRLRTALRRAEWIRGAFVKLPGLETIDVLATAGADFCVLDLEHAALADGEAFAQVAYARALGLPCLVRLPTVDAAAICRWLDAGAAGIQIADVASGEEAALLVRASRYPPVGDRGVSPSQRDGGYGALSAADLVGGGAGAPVLVAQIERDLGPATLDQIAASGIDVLFLGPVDLAARLAAAPNPSRSVSQIATDVAAAGLRADVVVGEHAAGEPLMGREARYVTRTTDVTALARGLRQALERRA
jgi:4-hydroxy-2-oxoheptanedioate aldolase